MALISGQITTFNAPNYEGDLYNVTPEDTPLLSAIGGLYGGDPVGTTVWSWQEHDLRDASQTGGAEGQNAPAGTGRTRTNVKNVLQIIHEVVEVSDTKQATNRMVQDIGSAHPNVSSAGQGNPVMSEMDWQIEQRLKEIARDSEFTLINGTFVEPADNNSDRQTKGLLEAIVTNAVDVATGSTSATGEDVDDLIDDLAHGRADGDKIQFTALTGGANLETNVTYYVVTALADTFQIATSAGGAPLDFGSNITAATYEVVRDVTVDDVESLMQDVWDNGGIRETETGVLIANSWNLRKLNAAFLSSSGAGFRQSDRTVGGTNLDTVMTPFGKLGVMLNRYIPKNTISVASLEELRMKWLAQERGTFYAEPLPRQGIAERTQLSGEWGLQFGNERSHGKLSGLSTR